LKTHEKGCKFIIYFKSQKMKKVIVALALVNLAISLNAQKSVNITIVYFFCKFFNLIMKEL